MSSYQKVVHNISIRLQREENKFRGEIGQSWNEYVSGYMQVARDHGLTPQQNLLYLQNILDGDAKRFYFDSVDNHVHTFNHAVELIGYPNHVLKQSAEKIDTVRAAKAKIEYLAKKTGMNRVSHTVSYELCKQLDHEDSD